MKIQQPEGRGGWRGSICIEARLAVSAVTVDIEGIFVVCGSQRRRLWQVCELDLHLQLFSPLWNNDVQVSVFYLKESVSESRVSPCYILNVQESEKRGQITVLLCPQTKTENICYPYFVIVSRGAIQGFCRRVIIILLAVQLQFLSVFLLLSFSSSYWASKPPLCAPTEQESPYCVNIAAVLSNWETDWIWTCVWTLTSIRNQKSQIEAWMERCLSSDLPSLVKTNPEWKAMSD